jgi:3-keto-5-aminohexanoate cleavage enzyme
MGTETWLEVALNGPWGKSRQPSMPIAVRDIVQEGIAAARAGAAIVHFHAYDEHSGIQKDDWQLYAKIIEGIRAEADVIAYPTIPLAGSRLTGQASSARERYRHVDELAARGLLEWSVVDPGSVNFRLYDRDARGESGFVYLNPDEHIEEGLRLCAEHKLHPSFAIYEPGFARLGAALAAKQRGVPCPVYRLMFSDEFAWGFPPERYGLQAYLALLHEFAPASPWMVAGLGVDVTPLIEPTIANGGHLRVGLEDAHFGTEKRNAELVEEAARLAQRAGAQLASAEAIRRSLRALDQGSDEVR